MSKDKRLIIIGLLTLIVASVSIPEVGATAPGTRVRIEPADLVADLNETFVIQVVIEEANDLGAFQFNLTYDPSIVQVTEATLGDFLESTGNFAVAIGHEVNNAEGRVTLGAISFGSAAGPSGTGVLATITCIAQGEGSTALGLQEVQVLDTAASVQWVTVKDGQVVVRSVEAPTPTVTATPASAATATPAPPPTVTSAPAATATPVPAVTTTPAPAATVAPMPTNTPEAMDALTPAATALPSPTPSATSPAAETPTETPSPSPTPSSMPGVSIAPTETRPTEAATSLAVPTTEATQAPAAATTTPTSPPATPPPPSPSATPLPPPTPIPSPIPLATIPVPAATGSSGGAVLGLMLTALAMAVLAIFILSRRPGG